MLATYPPTKIISDHLGEKYILNDKFLTKAFTAGSELYEAIEALKE